MAFRNASKARPICTLSFAAVSKFMASPQYCCAGERSNICRPQLHDHMSEPPVKRAPAPLIQIHLVPVCPQYGRQLVHRFRDLKGALGHRECRIPYDEAANK